MTEQKPQLVRAWWASRWKIRNYSIARSPTPARDIGGRQLRFSRVEQSKAGGLLCPLAAVQGAGLASVQALAH